MRTDLDRTRSAIARRRRLGTLLAAALVAPLVATTLAAPPAAAQTSTLFDFDTAGDLAANFNSFGTGVADVSQSLTGGIGDSGALTVPADESVDAIYSSKEGYSIGPVGSTYIFSTFIKSEGNSGYSGVGFTTASPATGTAGFVHRPDDALGVSVHGGGFVFHNGSEDISGNWSGFSDASITEVTATVACGDLINNNGTECGSPDKWYRVVFRIVRSAESAFDLRVEVWPVDDDGTLRYPSAATAVFELNGIDNPTIRTAPQIFAYFNFSGERVTAFDDYRIDLSGGATVVAPGAPVVLTDTVTGGSGLSVTGTVSSQGASAVTERGFVYAVGATPTVADAKVASGSGTGAFSASATPATSGTYRVRAYATNGTGTSYGAESTVEITVSDGGGGGGDGGDGGDATTAPSPDPAAEAVVPIVQQAGTLTGGQALLQRGGTVVPITLNTVPTVGPQGGVVMTADGLRVTVSGDGGVSPQGGVTVSSDGEIVCEVCARLAAGGVIEGWLYSEARLAAAVRIDGTELALGDLSCPLLRIPLAGLLDGLGPVDPGVHTLQLRYPTDAGLEVVALRINVADDDAALAPTRVSAGGGPVADALTLRVGGLLAAAGALALSMVGRWAGRDVAFTRR